MSDLQAPAPQNVATPVVIGAGSALENSIDQALIATGVKVAQTALAASQPWTTLPVISFLVGEGIKFAVTKTVMGVDQAVYVIYISIAAAQQVSAYVIAQETSNQSAIDQAADNLIHDGDL